jgi:DNA modification methylase
VTAIDLSLPWQVIHGDCLEVMRQLPDGCVDAVVTDPPYGIGAGMMNFGMWRTSRMEKKEWDATAPDLGWILELGKPTIVWGGNYFDLPPTRGFLVWNKGAGFKGRDFAECELAWTNQDSCARVLTRDPLASGDYKHKEHPTQKPTALMKWCLQYLSLELGSTILDPFCGSGSTGVAAVEMGYRFVGIERESSYVDIARRRIADAAAQTALAL